MTTKEKEILLDEEGQKIPGLGHLANMNPTSPSSMRLVREGGEGGEAGQLGGARFRGSPRQRLDPILSIPKEKNINAE